MKNEIFWKGLTVGIIFLFLLMSVPVASSNETSVLLKKYGSLDTDGIDNVITESYVAHKKSILSYDDEYSQSKSDRLVDNIKIRCYGQFKLINILFLILGAPVPFINLEIISYNDIPITIEDHFTLIDTKNDRILYDFNAGGLPWKLQPHVYFTTAIFTNVQWKGANYVFGPFDLIYRLHIPEDNSSTTVIFHGFVFRVGAKIFNSAGEVIE
ncbi:MAG: hypothetical protein A3K77_07705 [Euryarchaeota archaeon RBG_13_31_8]|nr:MAG: hypothetical protein A3K77_07705 [Euryarchaeota archaeon RBG_13_31_8]